MLKTGLVSVTFRAFSSAAIIDLAKKGRLQFIEWGGDIHVPHGDVQRAREVRRQTQESGLSVSAYGSYYRLAKSERDGLRFESVLQCAVELAAPTIRVWAGDRGSKDADAQHWQSVVDNSRLIADLAAAQGITISYESHVGTLTDTAETARRLLDRVAHANVKMFWQPAVNESVQTNVDGLAALLPWLTNVHAYHWIPSGESIEKLAFEEGESAWRDYVNVIKTSGRDHVVSLEFVRGEDPEQLLRDAQVLNALLAE